MATTESHHDHQTEEEDAEQFIESDDILEEIPVGEDELMDEDDEGDILEGGEEGEEIVWEDNSIQHFPTHQGSVFAVSTHPSQPIAISGGEDDLGYLWDFSNGESITKLTGHTDSVTSAAFSFDGEMVSTGGMDGKVRVWRRVGKQDWNTWEFLTELQGSDEIMASDFHAPSYFK